MSLRILPLAALLVATALPATVLAAVSLRLVQAYHKPDRDYLLGYADANGDSPLYPAVLARAVDVHAAARSLPKPVDALLRQAGVPAVEKLRGALLKEWAKLGRWSEFERHVALVPDWYTDKDIEFACAKLSFLRAAHQPVPKALIEPILIQDAQFPELCGTALQGIVNEGHAPADLVLQKALAVPVFARKTVASALAQSLGADLDGLPRQAGQVRKALDILWSARSDLAAARTALKSLATSLDPNLYRLTMAHLGVVAAHQHRPDAHALIKSADGYRLPMSRSVAEWRSRAAIQAMAWDDLLTSIESMSATDQETTTWRYWRAIGLQHTNRKSEAHAMLAGIAVVHDYYGLLARGNRVPSMRRTGTELQQDANWASKISITPQYKRALALYEKGLWVEGALEMNVLLRGASAAQYLTAAGLANQNGLTDRQISYSDRAGDSADKTLSYPLLYEREVGQAASQEGVTAATIYAVMRQESRFVPHAISSAGALGLMQIMPGTAKRMWGQRREGAPFSDLRLFEPTTNIALGAAYLAKLQQRYSGNLAYVAAAYNAGPQRVDDWLRRSHGSMDAAFVELIPFDETREYVKAVLTNEAMYRARLGTDRSESRQANDGGRKPGRSYKTRLVP